MTTPRLTTAIAALSGVALAFAACSRQEEAAAPASETPAPEKTEVTHLDAAGAAKTIADNPDITVLDVRTPEEYAEGHLAGAVNIDYRSASFEENVLGQLHRDKPYLLHCRSGGRSSSALEQMTELGFTRLYHLDGGISAWIEAGNPVEK